MIAIYAVVVLVIAGIAALLSRRHVLAPRYIALAGSLAALAIITYAFVYGSAGTYSIPWFGIGQYSFPIVLETYSLNMLLLLLVGVITPLIFLYSIGFMDVPTEQGRFYFEISVFAAAMMLFAIAGNLITMFLAWEMLGITSYLLIGFWYYKGRAAEAARKAITIIIIGDVLMLSAILLIFSTYHTMSFNAILAAPYSSSLTVAMALLLVAIFTKSAQFPFHEWLPDAMEGPTPVSAFLHSSTMVKAGVFLAAVLLPLFAKAGLLRVMLVVGLVSALLGASNALAERHVKRIPAYSTIEDIGLMFVALGLNALAAAMLFFVVQAFYKALLFMSAGSIMRANNETTNIYDLYGASKRKIIAAASIIGALSLAGIAPLSGFFGKAAIGTASLAVNALVYAVLMVIGFASSIYIFRWLIVPMRKAPEGEEVRLSGKYAHIPRSMLAAPAILAVMVVAVSVLYLYLPGYLSQHLSDIGVLDAAIESGVAVAGIAIAYVLFRNVKPFAPSRHRMAVSALYNSLLVNKAYQLIARFFYAIGAGIDSIDNGLYEAALSGGNGVVYSGRQLRRIVTGQPNMYLVAALIGIMLLVVVMVV